MNSKRTTNIIQRNIDNITNYGKKGFEAENKRLVAENKRLVAQYLCLSSGE